MAILFKYFLESVELLSNDLNLDLFVALDEDRRLAVKEVVCCFIICFFSVVGRREVIWFL